MCVAAVAWNAHPAWLLVAAGNRDEFHDRPAAPLAPWGDGSGIIAGRDLRSGGTWLGVSTAGRFTLVTNLRGHGGPDPALASRGGLVTALLAGDDHPDEPRTDDGNAYNPFNLLVADAHQACLLTNRPKAARALLASGVHGLSNDSFDEPSSRTLHLTAAMRGWLESELHDPALLLSALAAGLPDTPVFIRDPVYGTRCSTVVLIDRAGAGLIVERRFDAGGAATGETVLDFTWPLFGGT
jgi:uncharacterized protein with NRDE domain